MRIIPGYKIVAKISEGAKTIIYRGIRERNRKYLTLKVLKERYPNPKDIAKLKYEYQIAKNLDIKGILKPLALENKYNNPILLLEDYQGQSLARIIAASEIDLKTFFKIAIQIGETLGKLQQKNIIHKNIKPENILIDSEIKQIKITDFSICSLLSRETQTIKNLDSIEGTLAYMSPEQTGRINRSIDYRTDFYSLGVTFYEMLARQLPFQATTAIEIVHSHIAKPPLPLKPEIPRALAQIVLKLLAKSAAQRYQSAFGLKADLENCWQQLETTGKITEFKLGKHDCSGNLQIPSKLYGRAEEISNLMQTFARVKQGATEIVLVCGFSGIGKSALVNEVDRPIVKQGGYFIRGKFDQYQRNIPYSALIRAFEELIRQLLTETSQQIASWQEKLLAALNPNAGVIIDVIPEVELIIGKQPAVPELEPTEAQNRFKLVFQKFIGVFTQKEHPLVIFLDDLQWADPASLQLIEVLTIDRDSKYLLAIGAYRDNEVSLTHPLTKTLAKLTQANVKIVSIVLRSLSLDRVNQLIARTLDCNKQKSLPLAELLFIKTNGNPFFLIQLLKSIYQENLLTFDYNNGIWLWDIERIKKVGITDNVIELIASKIRKLERKTQNILRLAACLGNQFDLNVLALVNEKSPSATAADLWEAIQVGSILPLNDNYNMFVSELKTSEPPIKIEYKFLHDRVQQAAYSLIPAEQIKKIHLNIGQVLLENTKPEILEEKIFDLVNHFNIGRELLSDRSQKYRLAELNLIASKKAKLATAYEAACRYGNLGLKLLSENSWQQRYQLTLALYLEVIEAEYLDTNYNRAIELADFALQRAKTYLDEVKLADLKLKSYISQNEMKIAIDLGIEILKMLDISLDREEPKQIIIEDLIDLPEITDPDKLAAMQILSTLISPAFIAAPEIILPIISTMVRLCSSYGNSPLVIYPYALYGLFLCNRITAIDLGYQFGRLALKLLDKFAAKAIKFKCKVYHAVSLCILYWKEPLKENVERQIKAIQIGLEIGDIEYTCYGAMYYCANIFIIDNNLKFVVSKQKEYLNLIKKFGKEFPYFFTLIWLQIALKLTGESRNEEFNEPAIIKYSIETNNIQSLHSLYITKLILCYLFADYDRALENARLAEEYAGPIIISISYVEHNFYHSLALLAVYNNAKKTEREKYLDRVAANQEKMKNWAYHAPMNFQHKYELVAAELHRVLDNKAKAANLYESAITLTKKYQYLKEEALAWELAAKFYLEWHKITIAKTYISQARYCYFLWGAIAKVKDLEAKYPQLFDEFESEKTIKQPTKSIINTVEARDPKMFDIDTLLKANQIISGELNLAKLLTKLIEIAIENAGASLGYLILQQEGNLTIEAISSIASTRVTVLQSLAIDSKDSNTQLPLLPEKIINYVARSQQDIVLDNASSQVRFASDPYIAKKQPKSLLCVPLVDRAQLVGLVYLENNLTTAAFTSDRVAIVKILASQAAISIENARLYDRLADYSQNLEKIVAQRTQELSQTVDILQATQAKLVFENDLLRKSETASEFSYQVGGSLAMDSPTYVVRAADRYLYEQLKQGEFCYILTPRQMGKSSLMVRMMHHLEHQGFRCAAIDMTRVGSENITPQQWYKSAIVELWRSFGLLRKVNFKSWWQEREDISLVQRLSQFIEEVLLVEVESENNAAPPNIVIFIDEIDSLLALNFSINDFFALIRSCYNQRGINPDYRRLTFVILGVATPNSLIDDYNKTPFNIGKLIKLSDFKEHEAQPLLQGLKNKIKNPQTILKAVLAWTGGQPFLTQKVCKLIRNSDLDIPVNSEIEWIANLVTTKIINNWESQDEPEHLRTVRDRIIHSDRPAALLEIYRQILAGISFKIGDRPELEELILSGIVIEQERCLRIHNRIYQLIFDRNWVEFHLKNYNINSI